MKKKLLIICLLPASLSAGLLMGCGHKEPTAAQAPPSSPDAQAPPPYHSGFPRGTSMQPPKMAPPKLTH